MNAVVLNPYGAGLSSFQSFKALATMMGPQRGVVWREEDAMHHIDLAAVDALLIPSGDHLIAAQHVAAIRAWVEQGGSLMLLSAFGGDQAPHGHKHHRCNLSELLPGHRFESNAVVRKLTAEDAVARVVAMSDDELLYERERVSTPFQVPVDLGQFREWFTHMASTGALPSVRSVCEVSVGVHKRVTYAHGCTIAPDNRGWTPPVVVEWVANVDTDALQLKPFSVPRLRHGSDTPGAIDHARCGVALRVGAGRVVAWGSSYQFSDDFLGEPRNLRFATWLLEQWLHRAKEHELQRRMREPQRHRLLHAYPMSPLAKTRPQPTPHLELVAEREPGRSVLVGVLPHPFCNPQVRGCGFCVFPHEPFARHDAERCADATLREMRQRFEYVAGLRGARCDAIYFGGATANLTSAAHLEQLLRLLGDHLCLDQPEVTLEGVPVYFGAPRGEALLDLLAQFTARPRISMGIQTFDEGYLREMGRTAFGTFDEIARIAGSARARGIGTSGDLLIDLPGQTLAMIFDDIAKADAIGLDQICLYHLVLAPGLGTEWARDPAKLAALPDNEEAAQRWQQILAHMVERGFVQTTLTNFERREVLERGRGFLYEPAEMAMAGHDFIGFGPSAITRLKSNDLQSGLTLLNPTTSADYVAAMTLCHDGLPWNRYFAYTPEDMQVLLLTRNIALGKFDFERFQMAFGVSARSMFGREFELFSRFDLMAGDGTLTARGQTYADSMAGLLASRQLMHMAVGEVLIGHRPQPEAVITRFSNRALHHSMG